MKSVKQATAEVVLALMQLILVLELDDDATNLVINYHGREQRLDIARLDSSGQYLAEWLCGVNANVAQPAHVGEPVWLPTTTGSVQ